MIPTPIVIFRLCFALLICLTLFASISQILFQICRHFFRARFLSLDPSRMFHGLPFGSRLFFRNILSNILEALDRLLAVRHFVLTRTHVAPGIIDNFIYLAHIRAFFYQLLSLKKVSLALHPAFDRVFPTFYPVLYRFYYVISRLGHVSYLVDLMILTTFLGSYGHYR